MDLGTFIKSARKAKGFRQKDLAEGICTQATISNLEKNTGLPSIKTLVALSDRLSIDFNMLVEYLPNKNTKIELFQVAKELLRKQDYVELKKVLKTTINPNDLTTSEIKEYRYLKGMIALYGEKKFNEALYQFNVGLQEGNNKKTWMIETLTINGIGMTYFLNNEVEKSTIYIKKAVDQLDEMASGSLQLGDLNEGALIYSTTASYYSYMKDYKKANSLYMKAINLQKRVIELFGLDKIYYERGVNLAKMGDLKQAEKLFFIGLGIAEINENKVLIDELLEAAKHFGFKSIQYEK
ncbi:helix-turn-helix transcriptional regulator [Carnobacterium maltaromaticum]|uniref:helix-turn-helix domain-containing protein n=1 Tax=Carnobacterium maltaromaticum TaxID=2751 RepID=UPI00295E61FE|nr:helix-turn-helix transcriptional regulator [Carnobacterium maltaromaticum]